MRRLVAALGALASLAACVAGGTGCNVEGTEGLLVQCPPRENFTEVSTVFERRCGTLDCHGEASRPLRIYGRLGLRLDPANPSGGPDTTSLERDENYLSICGLEPMLMNDVVTGTASPRQLQVLRKPLAVDDDTTIASGEFHKGGDVLQLGGDGYTCIESWLTSSDGGVVDVAACERAVTLYK